MSLYYQEAGASDGFPVVLLHGFPFDREIWANQDDLKDDFRIITPDLPGFGRSDGVTDPESTTIEMMADGVIRILDGLGIARAVVMGHSMGGYVALAIADRHMERLAGFGLICSHASADTEEIRENRQRQIASTQAKGIRTVMTAMREKLLSPETKRSRPDLIAAAEAIMNRASVEGVVGALHAMANRPDRRGVLPQLTVPALVLCGEADQIVPVEKAAEVAQAIQDATLVTVPSSGHMPMLEDKHRFNTALLSFLKRTRISGQ